MFSSVFLSLKLSSIFSPFPFKSLPSPLDNAGFIFFFFPLGNRISAILFFFHPHQNKWEWGEREREKEWEAPQSCSICDDTCRARISSRFDACFYFFFLLVLAFKRYFAKGKTKSSKNAIKKTKNKQTNVETSLGPQGRKIVEKWI